MIIFLLGVVNTALVVQLPMSLNNCRTKNYLLGSTSYDDCNCIPFNKADQIPTDYNACTEKEDGAQQPGCMGASVSTQQNTPLTGCAQNDILNLYKNLFSLGPENTAEINRILENGKSKIYNQGPPNNGHSQITNNTPHAPVVPGVVISPINLPHVHVAKNNIHTPVVVKTHTVYTTIIHRVEKPVFNYVRIPPVTLTAKGSTTTYTMPPLTVTETKPPLMIPLPPSTVFTTAQASTFIRTVVPPAFTKTEVATMTVVQKVQPSTVTSVEVHNQPPSTVFVPPVSVTTTATRTLPPVVFQVIRTSTSYVTITTTITVNGPTIPIYIRPDSYLYPTVSTPNTPLKLSTTTQSIPGAINKLGNSNGLVFGNGFIGPFSAFGSQSGSNGKIYLPMPLNTSSSGSRCASTPGVICLSDLMSNGNKAGHSMLSCGFSSDSSECNYSPTGVIPSDYSNQCMSGQYSLGCDINMPSYNNIGLCNGADSGSIKEYCVLGNDSDSYGNNSDTNVEVIYLSDLMKQQGIS
ncbi:hypothetical protein PAEPH01_1186 [Pancytospora epiphaga]|nr:hypothetical protein PAEPH01_1186 [Pancytospora epiphaga]